MNQVKMKLYPSLLYADDTDAFTETFMFGFRISPHKPSRSGTGPDSMSTVQCRRQVKKNQLLTSSAQLSFSYTVYLQYIYIVQIGFCFLYRAYAQSCHQTTVSCCSLRQWPQPCPWRAPHRKTPGCCCWAALTGHRPTVHHSRGVKACQRVTSMFVWVNKTFNIQKLRQNNTHYM